MTGESPIREIGYENLVLSFKQNFILTLVSHKVGCTNLSSCLTWCAFFEYHLQLVKLAKKLKKEKVNVDIVNFGEEVYN